MTSKCIEQRKLSHAKTVDRMLCDNANHLGGRYFDTEVMACSMYSVDRKSIKMTSHSQVNRACNWNRKRSLFMSAKLSLGDIVATEMHASDDGNYE